MLSASVGHLLNLVLGFFQHSLSEHSPKIGDRMFLCLPTCHSGLNSTREAISDTKLGVTKWDSVSWWPRWYNNTCACFITILLSGSRGAVGSKHWCILL